MYSLNTEVVGALALLAVGCIIGMWLGQRMSSQGQKGRDLERKLDRVIQEKKAYEDGVAEHFNDTARLLNDLTENYRSVHNHLATGAANLCQGQAPVILERLVDGNGDEVTAVQMEDVRPPLDYAPKSSPDEKGMLNESFGLEKEASAETINEPERI